MFFWDPKSEFSDSFDRTMNIVVTDITFKKLKYIRNSITTTLSAHPQQRMCRLESRCGNLGASLWLGEHYQSALRNCSWNFRLISLKQLQSKIQSLLWLFFSFIEITKTYSSFVFQAQAGEKTVPPLSRPCFYCPPVFKVCAVTS